jgi:YfiH family protein
MSQVHGIEVAALDDIRADVPITADAAISRRRMTVCTAMMADCLTVLFADRSGSVVAAAHAGWRGLAAGVLEATVASMQVPPETIIAYMGPAIGPAAFEVGDDVFQSFVTVAQPDEVDAVRAAFRDLKNAAPGKWLADLYRLACIRIERAGVEPDAIFGGGLCTYTDRERFFSHRRGTHEGLPSGRMAAMIWLS